MSMSSSMPMQLQIQQEKTVELLECE